MKRGLGGSQVSVLLPLTTGFNVAASVVEIKFSVVATSSRRERDVSLGQRGGLSPIAFLMSF